MSGLRVEDEISALRRQVRELSEELEEYRRPPGSDERFALRVHAARRAPGLRQVCAMGMRLILTLVDRAPQIVSNRHLHLMLSRNSDDTQPKVVAVVVCRTRKVLQRQGLAIETAWGVGYSMSREHADTVRRLIGEGGSHG